MYWRDTIPYVRETMPRVSLYATMPTLYKRPSSGIPEENINLASCLSAKCLNTITGCSKGTQMNSLQSEPALLIFSGGQDSGTCLGWALNRFDSVITVGFNYGQRHKVEMDCRRTVREKTAALEPGWGARLGEDIILNLDLFQQIGDTAMTSEMLIAMDDKGYPNTFVPGRNLMFMAAAAALAWRKGIRHIIIGVCETDYSGYPDCRDDAVKSMQVALNVGMRSNFSIHTPLMWLTKAQTWEMARFEGGEAFVELVRTETHTCYLGTRGELHPWGYGCGECPSCRLRAHGWESFASHTGIPVKGVSEA